MLGLMAVGSKTRWASDQGVVRHCGGKSANEMSGSQIDNRADCQWLANCHLLFVFPTAIVAVLLLPVSVVHGGGCIMQTVGVVASQSVISVLVVVLFAAAVLFCLLVLFG